MAHTITPGARLFNENWLTGTVARVTVRSLTIQAGAVMVTVAFADGTETEVEHSALTANGHDTPLTPVLVNTETDTVPLTDNADFAAWRPNLTV